jgi:hypothetical protein
MQMKNQEATLGGLSARERQIVGGLRRDGFTVIDNQILIQRYEVSRNTANQMLIRLEKKGWLQRVERGRYIFVELTAAKPNPIAEDALVLAMDLFSPCYLSGWTAAEHWGLTEQIFNSILVYSSAYQRTSEKKVGGINFVLRRVKDNEIFGTKIVWSSSRKIVMADKHRTIIDILNRPVDGGSSVVAFEICKEYFVSPDADFQTLLRYAERLGNGAVFKRLGLIAENIVPSQKEFTDTCFRNISKGISLFDPSGPKKGQISSKWNLRMNIAIGKI